MPRYVILHHSMPAESGRESHYDLMLEQDGQLLTWAFAELPRGELKTTATRLPDHRLAYLDYEGPVSANRGEVQRVEAGEYVCNALDGEHASFELLRSDGRLIGQLQHVTGDQWTARFSV